MNSIYKSKSEALIDICGRNGRMSFVGAATIFMNLAEAHEDHMGNGIASMARRGMHWVMAKAQYRLVNSQEIFTTEDSYTWCIKPKNFRAARNFVIGSIENPMVIGRADWAILSDSGKIMKITDVVPEELEFQDFDIFKGEEWPRVEREFDESNSQLLGRYIVKSTDIDFIGHMNNVAYVRAIMSCYSCDETEKFKDFFIQYLASCFEGEELIFFEKNWGGFREICAKRNGEAVIYARIK